MHNFILSIINGIRARNIILLVVSIESTVAKLS
jgi:hypothetical protein